jgi:sulfatase maturation enzyme AslB (radical SAM superfamily)
VPDSNIFCNVPWYDLHIYWDGSFGVCCNETHKIYSESNREYNVTSMSIRDWFNSEPVRKFRTSIQHSRPLSPCKGCYLEEEHGGHSRRLKENQKSVIFAQAFDDSYKQSPSFKHFAYSADSDGYTNIMPIDIHVNIGNFCNLACKMCMAESSSTIASQEVQWGIVESKKYLGVDWTKNPTVWNSFKQQLLEIDGLNNIHFMGGETLLTDRVEDLVDTMIEHQRFDVCFSFVTNGTVFKPTLLDKLKQFKRVGIEVSIETTTAHNAYQRQGTDTAEVLANIQRYRDWCNGSSITITLRPAPSLLTIGYYPTLLEYALSHKLLVKSILCHTPSFLYAVNLPAEVKQHYAEKYASLITQLSAHTTNNDFNASDPTNFELAVKQEAEMCLAVLSTPQPTDAEEQLADMVAHCRKWDKVYKLDAKQLYPELADVWDRYAY